MILPKRSLLLKLLLLTSAILTAIFGCTGYFLEKSISARTTAGLEQEVIASFQAYEALWREHTDNLQKISSVISRMADVRAAFMTNDSATIQDTAGELWSHISSGNALLAVADGTGRVMATLGQHSPFRIQESLDFIHNDLGTLTTQKAGFLEEQGRLFQVVITPIYVDAAGGGKGLVDVLVTGFELDEDFMHALQLASGGSDLIFKLRGNALASTIENKARMRDLSAVCSQQDIGQRATRVEADGATYLALRKVLPSIVPGDSGELCIVRSLNSEQQALHALRRRVLGLWLAGLIAAILCTYAVVRGIMGPVETLDKAASEIAKGNYHIRIEENRSDELGRLANSFNTMCASLENARTELIRHERLTSVARLATSVVHDLRNPLASIYAGAEMLVDSDLPERQVKRLARNMYQASRGVMEILQELLSAARNEPHQLELCHLSDLIMTAWNGLAVRMEVKRIRLDTKVPADLELTLDRVPMERVFHNLFENAFEAMSDEGKITIWTETDSDYLYLHIRDDGKGIDPELRSSLFQPFATKGRAEGLGLGLALSRQTIQAHGGDLWADFECPSGSHFLLKLPLQNTNEQLDDTAPAQARG